MCGVSCVCACVATEGVHVHPCMCLWLSTNDSYPTDTCPDDQAWLPLGQLQQVRPDLHAGGICVVTELQLLPLAD